MSITAIVPCHDSSAWIGECLKSILAQPGVELEVIVVDDGSADDTCQIVEEIASGDSRVRLLRHAEAKGPGAVRNAGVAAARHDFITFVDSDDLLAPDSLAALEREALRADAGIVCGGFAYFNEKSATLHEMRPLRKPASLVLDSHEALEDFLRGENLLANQCGKLYRRSLLQRMEGPFHEKWLNEDTHFTGRVVMQPSRVAVIPELVYLNRQHPESLSKGDPARMTRDMHAVLEDLERLYAYMEVWEGELKELWRRRYVRSMLYTLLQAAQRLPARDYRALYQWVRTNTPYEERLKGGIYGQDGKGDKKTRVWQTFHNVVAALSGHPGLLLTASQISHLLRLRMP